MRGPPNVCTLSIAIVPLSARLMAQSRRASSPERRKILVVYDGPSMRAFGAVALRSIHDLVEVGNTATALGLLTRSRNHFDAVLVCVARNKVNERCPGIRLVGTMFERWPWIPVIVICRAQDRARLVAEALPSSAREFFSRPVAAADLRRSIKRVVRRLGSRVPAGPAIVSIGKVLFFLGDHVLESPRLGQLAAMASMGRSHFSHTFHDVVGMPLRDYVRDLRLKGAVRLLLASSLSLTAIAVDAGFYDLPHFDKAFRQRLGMSPQEFQRAHGTRRHASARGALARHGRVAGA